MTGKLNNARNSSVMKAENQPNPKKIHMQCQRKQCLVDIQSETWSNSLWQITMQKQKSINSVWWSATCGREMGKVEIYSLPFPSNNYHSHSHSRETSLAISIRMGMPWDPWEFPT